MPWLAATALLHSVTVLANRDGLRAWTLMLAVIAFSMSMIGTFLVRSGILTSVHAFAVDPERGSFILALLALYIGGAMIVYALSVGRVRAGASFKVISREGLLVVNNLLLSVILALVLVGTLYPLAIEAVAGEKLSVGAPYFNSVIGPLALLLTFFMAIGPLLKWRKDTALRAAKQMALPLIIIGILLIILVLRASDAGVKSTIGLALAGGLAIASFIPLWRRNLRRTPLPLWGTAIAHFGVAVALIGMASESSFSDEKLVAVEAGDRVEISGWRLHFDGVEPLAGPNWTALEAVMTAQYDGGDVITLTPQNRNFPAAQMQTSEAALLNRWNGQLYVVLGQGDDQGKWQLRLWWKPFVALIWYGGLLICLGGILSLFGRISSDWKARGRNDLERAGGEGDQA